ncbi:hypothetical protein [Streptomyces sp. NBC_01304]|uniref:hypothetical protein n=1 Tax=Streptomyces sp. NBC_01304 TaxID=2903818 RepID=UPI002E14207B|nr:hypothetical protein OG430_34445 [Streptomyces sp. NBC_01304]
MTTRLGERRWGQLLLFAALLFGIFAMHTLGHPVGHAGASSSSGHEVAAAAAGGHEVVPAAAGHSSRVAAGHGSQVAAGHQQVRVTTSGPDAPAMNMQDAPATAGSPVHGEAAGPVVSGPDVPVHGMDPMTVCLAVLGAFTLALLVAAALLPGTAPAPSAPRAPPLRALWPAAPPPRSRLSRLSVLRI